MLKSPLFGLDEDELFKLAWNREGSLRSALRDAAARHRGAARRACANGRASLTPFAFYAGLLGAERRPQEASWRGSATRPTTRSTNFSISRSITNARETPSLQGFVAWLRSAQAEVKRDMEMARDEVRVMTVHGAKGLEAPIVILADTTTPPQGFHPPRLLQLPAGRAPDADRCVWAAAKANDVGPMAAAREAALDEARDEYRRLLYVAMTRAIDRLIVCGVDGVEQAAGGLLVRLSPAARSKASASPSQSDDGSRRGAALPQRCRTPSPAPQPPKPAHWSRHRCRRGWLSEVAAAPSAPHRSSRRASSTIRSTAGAAAAARGAAARDPAAATSCTG